LPDKIQPLIGCSGVAPGDLNVVRDIVLQVSQPLLVLLGLQLRHGTSGGKQSAVKDRNVDIQAGSGVMAPQVRDGLAMGRCSRRRQCGNDRFSKAAAYPCVTCTRDRARTRG